MLDTNNKIDLFNDIHRTLISSFIASWLQKGTKGLTLGWQSEILHDLVALSVYHTILHRVKMSNFGSYEPLIDDLVKTSTIIYVSGLLSNKNLGYKQLITLCGVLFYHKIIRKPLLSLIHDKTKLNKPVIEGIEDSIETIILLSLDGDMSAIPYKLIGLSVYYYLIKMN
jgi:hypothetical protein